MKRISIIVATIFLLSTISWAANGPSITNIGGSGGTGSGDMLKADNLSGLADYGTARTNMGLAIGADVQAYLARLATMGAIAVGGNNTIYGVNGAGVEGWYSTHIHDDSTAQFTSSADTTKYVKIDVSNQGAGQTGTIRAPVNDTAVLSAGTQVAHDGTNLNLGAINFISTGIITGGIPILNVAATYTITGGSEAWGSLIQVSAASTLTNMAQTPRQGMSGCIYTTLGSAVGASGAMKLRPDSTSWFVFSGTAKAAGVGITSSGATGDYACWVVTAPSTIRFFAVSGTWT